VWPSESGIPRQQPDEGIVCPMFSELASSSPFNDLPFALAMINNGNFSLSAVIDASAAIARFSFPAISK
jgi:hypothetical protein